MHDSPSRYGPAAMIFHWVSALAIVATFCVGVAMSDLPFSPWRLKLFNWHKWAGITILVVSALRLLWRIKHRPPAAVAAPAWQQRAAHWTHVLLYVLFFAVPLAGWAYSSAAGFPVVVFGLIPLPGLLPVSEPLAAIAKAAHGVLAYGLATLVALHVAAALKHHFVDRDAVLLRMWPARAGWDLDLLPPGRPFE